MMKLFNLIHLSGPHGDETSSYRVDFPEGMTVAEFIPAIIKQNLNEWGDIEISWHHHKVVKYKQGEWEIVNEKVYETVKNKEIYSIISNGGWTNMDYTLYIKDKPKTKIVTTNKIIRFPF